MTVKELIEQLKTFPENAPVQTCINKLDGTYISGPVKKAEMPDVTDPAHAIVVIWV